MRGRGRPGEDVRGERAAGPQALLDEGHVGGGQAEAGEAGDLLDVDLAAGEVVEGPDRIAERRVRDVVDGEEAGEGGRQARGRGIDVHEDGVRLPRVAAVAGVERRPVPGPV